MGNSKRNAVIGVFVVGAVALAVSGILIFGGGKFFTKKVHYVMYFEGSVKGLNVGAPVVFQGVKIGTVTDITLVADPKTLRFRIPVVVEIEPDKIKKIGPVTADMKKYLQPLIDKGLRAELQIQSIVTGQLQIGVVFRPHEKARFVGGKTPYPEIPTTVSSMGKLSKELERFPLQEIGLKLSKTLSAIEKVADNPELSQIVHNLNQTVLAAEKMVQHIDTDVVPATAQTLKHADKLVMDFDGQIKPLMDAADKTVRNVDRLVVNADRAVKPLATSIQGAADSIKTTSDSARPAVRSADKALASIATMTAQDSKQIYLMDNMLKEIAEASRAIRVLASYLERHPEALISGKGSGKGR